MKREDHHPAVIAIVEMFAKRAGIDFDELWAALDGQPTRAKLARDLAETFHPLVRFDDFSIETLPCVPKGATVRNVPQVDSEHILVGAKPHPHPFTAALRKRGRTVTEWAETNGLQRGEVKSWYLASTAGRTIPKRWADAIEAEFVGDDGKSEVPATKRTWKNGIQS